MVIGITNMGQSDEWMREPMVASTRRVIDGLHCEVDHR